MFLSIHRLEYVTSWFHMALVALMYWVEVESRMQVRRRVLYCNGSYSIVLVRNQRRRLSSLCVMVLLSMSTNQFSAMDRCRSWTNQWIKILSWGDNSLTEFYVSLTMAKPRRMKKSNLPTEASRTDWLRFSCSFIILNKDLYKPDKAREWIQ